MLTFCNCNCNLIYCLPSLSLARHSTSFSPQPPCLSPFWFCSHNHDLTMLSSLSTSRLVLVVLWLLNSLKLVLIWKILAVILLLLYVIFALVLSSKLHSDVSSPAFPGCFSYCCCLCCSTFYHCCCMSFLALFLVMTAIWNITLPLHLQPNPNPVCCPCSHL